MADKDIFSKLLIDEILNDVKKYSGESKEIKQWSLEEIDLLLADKNDAESDVEIPSYTKVKEVVPAYGKSAAESDLKQLIKNIAVENTYEHLEKEAQKKEINPPEQEQPEIEEKPEEIPGQITIEKTRTFNEVEARAVHSDKIKHNIGRKNILKSNQSKTEKPIIETDKYRERFLNRPQLKLEKTMEHKELLDALPPKTIEKPGIIVKNPTVTEPSKDGLSPIPTIVSVDDELKAISQNEMKTQRGSLKSLAVDADEQIKDQIMLEGFETKENVDQVDEYQTEINLIKRRREKAKDFRLFPNIPDKDAAEKADNLDDKAESAYDKTLQSIDVPKQALSEPGADDKETKKKQKKKKEKSSQSITVGREYFGPRDANAIYKIFHSDRKKSLLKIILTLGYMAVLTFCSIFISLTKSFALFGESEFVYILCSIVLLFIVAFTNFKAMKDGLKSLFKGTITAETGAGAAIIIGIAQCIAAFFYPSLVESQNHIYSAVAILPLLLLNIGAFIKTNNDIKSFETLCSNDEAFYTVGKIDNEENAFEIGRGLLLTEPDIRYNSKAGFLSKFVELTKTSEPADSVAKIAIPTVLIAGAIIGIMSLVLTKNPFTAFTAITGIVLMGLPSVCILSTACILRSANKALSSDEAFISGYSAVEDSVTANAICIDAADLFLFSGSNIYGIKTFHSMRIDEAILYTASVVIESGGALSDVFDAVILSRRDLLPAVESLVYEEKLGCSGWIYNHRILVGSRDLLYKHNVEVPPIEEENSFKTDDRQVLYLAVEGKIAAMFVVGYNADEVSSDYIKKLEKYGISILIRTSDPNITEELIEDYFDLPRNFVKIINPVAGEIFKDVCENECPAAPCFISHNGNINSFFRAFSAAFIIEEKLKISKVLQFIGIGISLIVMSVLSLVSGLSQAGVMQMLLFQAVWMPLVLLVPKFKKI